MWEWLNTGIGAISIVWVWVTFLSWLSSCQTNKILARQGEILDKHREQLQGQRDLLQGQRDLLQQMEANALARYSVMLDKIEGRPTP